MGRETTPVTVQVLASVSRHNTPEDVADMAAVEALRIELEAAAEAITSRPEFDNIMGRPKREPREPGLWVVLSRPPGPDADFVELEDEFGRGQGPESGVEWRQEGGMWALGPFQRPS